LVASVPEKASDGQTVGSPRKGKSSARLPALRVPASEPSPTVHLAPGLVAQEGLGAPPTDPEVDGVETVEARLGPLGEQRVASDEPVEPAMSLLNPPLKWALAVGVPVVIAVGAYFGYVQTKKNQREAAPIIVTVPAPEREVPQAAPAAPKAPAAISPKPAPVETLAAPTPVKVAPAEARPAAAPPAQPKRLERKVAEVIRPSTVSTQPAPAEPAGGEGTLKLETQPYAEVYEGKQQLSDDGKKTLKLAAGKHSLRYHWNGSNFVHRIFVPANGHACVSAVFAVGAKPAFSGCK
jgi:hypothetical protein